MKVTSVNIGKAKVLSHAKAARPTGIYKHRTDEPVRVTYDGLVGDAICNTKHHGGVDQAVYVYGTPDYAWWSARLGQALRPGTFGENLTVTDLESATLHIGDRLSIGTTVLQVTAPRMPCATLATRMGDPMFLKRYRHAERPGVYCRVLQEGLVQIGDEVTVGSYEGETLGVLEMFRGFFKRRLDEAAVRRHLAAPIAVRERVAQEKKLEKLLHTLER